MRDELLATCTALSLLNEVLLGRPLRRHLVPSTPCPVTAFQLVIKFNRVLRSNAFIRQIASTTSEFCTLCEYSSHCNHIWLIVIRSTSPVSNSPKMPLAHTLLTTNTANLTSKTAIKMKRAM